MLFRRHGAAFELISTEEAVIDLISHLPEVESGPALHIVGTVSYVSGLCIFLALVISDLLVPEGQLVGAEFGAGSVLLAISFSIVSMWTLWQTRRIDFNTGHSVTDFEALIATANSEIKKVLDSYRRYNFLAQSFHRFYLITTQPFFGMVSYPTSEHTAEFKRHLDEMASYSKRRSPFNFNILCGDEEAIKALHQNAVLRANLSDDEKRKKSDEYDKQAFESLDLLKRASGAGSIKQRKSVPSVQFMIVGNKLFEFTLESGQQSEIFDTQIVADSRRCAAYVEMYNALAVQGASHGQPPPVSQHQQLSPQQAPQGALKAV